MSSFSFMNGSDVLFYLRLLHCDIQSVMKLFKHIPNPINHKLQNKFAQVWVYCWDKKLSTTT